MTTLRKTLNPVELRKLVLAGLAGLLLLSACANPVEPFSVSQVDRTTPAKSGFPLASHPERVGTYPGEVKSGAGYFYDEVLEYRVWMNPERGAARLAEGSDYFAAFANYESALAFSKATKGADPPLVLVRQIESVNEPTPGVFEWDKVERMTEWQVQWLEGTHRTNESIPTFLTKQHLRIRRDS